MDIETQEPRDQDAADLACRTTGHNWADVHGYWIGDQHLDKCVFLCACCGATVPRMGCETWKWCVSVTRWAEIQEEKKR